MNYQDAIIATVFADEAKREIELHSASWEEFCKEVGLRPYYFGWEVLDWLGY